ncbi:MAG TPA: hypothetical protein VE999_10925 [Gemmataceae bacterium]|jgi:hypothetical protein|nr:hypothetical protein [Gemmataceae bacterium]
MTALRAPEDQTTGREGLQCEIDRCHAEIAEAQRLLRAGHPDVQGLCLALSDWSAELRILEQEERDLPLEGTNS